MKKEVTQKPSPKNIREDMESNVKEELITDTTEEFGDQQDLNSTSTTSKGVIFATLKGTKRTIEINQSKVFIGRDPVACEVCLKNSPTVSTMHVQLEIIDDNAKEKPNVICVLRDLKSKNGTFVNNIRLGQSSSSIIKSGDLIQFGQDEVYRFDIGPFVSHVAKAPILDVDEYTSIDSPISSDFDIQEKVKEIYQDQKDQRESETKLEDTYFETMEPSDHLIDREVYKEESLREHLYAEINELTSALSTKIGLLNTVLCEDTPYHRNQVPFDFLKSMSVLSESIGFLTKDTIFERQTDIKFRELEQYANSLEKKLVNYKKLGKESETSLAHCKKLYSKSKDESNKKVHELTVSLHSRLDEIQLLHKGLAKEKDITNSLKTEIDRLKYRLSIEATQSESLRKSNEILRQQLIKTQDYSNFLHKEILKVDDYPLRMSSTLKDLESSCLNQTINATSIIEQYKNMDIQYDSKSKSENYQ